MLLFMEQEVGYTYSWTWSADDALKTGGAWWSLENKGDLDTGTIMRNTLIIQIFYNEKHTSVKT